MRWTLLLAVVATGCKRPPETPDGLDASLRHLLASFYGTDTELATGLDGLSEWYAAEGKDLLGKSATIDNVGSFTLEDLRTDEVGHFTPRPKGDPADAPGVIAVAELPCRWKQTDDLLVRPDQDEVFTDFDFYDRTYVTPLAAYEDARSGGFEPIDEPIDDLESVPGTLLLTANETSGTEMGVTIPFDLVMHARHGEFEVDGQPTKASLYATWMPERAEAKGGVNTMEQSYTFEIDLERGNQTLWVYASWSEVQTTVFDSDAPALLAISANKAQGTGERMAKICDGSVEVGD